MPTIGSQKGGLVSKAVAAVSYVVSVSWALVARRNDYEGMLVTTNPPFVGMLAWLTSKVTRRPYLLLVYDVFPEFAISLGVLTEGSWIAQAWRRAFRLTLTGPRSSWSSAGTCAT